MKRRTFIKSVLGTIATAALPPFLTSVVVKKKIEVGTTEPIIGCHESFSCIGSFSPEVWTGDSIDMLYGKSLVSALLDKEQSVNHLYSRITDKVEIRKPPAFMARSNC